MAQEVESLTCGHFHSTPCQAWRWLFMMSLPLIKGRFFFLDNLPETCQYRGMLKIRNAKQL